MGNEVSSNIARIIERKRKKTLDLCEYYAGRAKELFRERQIGGKKTAGEFWNNQTSTAYSKVFAESYIEGDEAGWFIAHAVEYGVYLELANDRKHEALRPIVIELEPAFMRDLKRIWE